MDLGQKYRDEFPVTRQWAYMNHAAVAPLSRRAAKAMQGLVEDVLCSGASHYHCWSEVYANVRSSAAKMIGASADEIAIVKNTSEGLSVVANGLDWRIGDVAVVVEGEFPANDLPWEALKKKGVIVRRVPQRGGRVLLDDLDKACRGARLLTVSFVQYLSGFRLDLEAAGGICARRNCLFVVDAIQGLGAFPVDVRKAPIHALSADAHKWLLGPEGCGILYVASDLIPRVTPVEFGWTNVARWKDYESRDMTLRPGAARYECGTLNTAGCYGMLAAIELLLEAGIDRIAGRITELTHRLAAGVTEKGYELMTPPDGDATSGILAFRKEGIDSGDEVRRLTTHRIALAPRSGSIRASPHFYISNDEVDRVVGLLR